MGKYGNFRAILVVFAFVSLVLIINSYFSIQSSYENNKYRFDAIESVENGGRVSNVEMVEFERLVKENNRLKDKLSEQSSVELESFKKIRVYCMVPTMFSTKKFSSWSAILQSWGNRCDILKLFVDPVFEEDYEYFDKETIEHVKEFQRQNNLENTTSVEVYMGNDLVRRTKVEIPKVFVDQVSGRRAEIVVLDMKRLSDKGEERNCWSGGKKDSEGETVYVKCKHIWEKVWRSWVYMHDTDVENADYFFKVDDDTYFFPDFVKLHASQHKWHAEDTHYFGHHLHHGRVKTGFIAGAAVGYSRGTLRKVVPLYKKMPNEYGDRSKFEHGRCVDRDGATQELAESKCLEDVGVAAEDTRDINGFEKTSLHGVGEVLLMRKRPGTTYWFWHGKESSAICCSTIPIAFHHYKQGNRMLRIHNLFFNQHYSFLMDMFSNHSKTKFVIDNATSAANLVYKTDSKKFASGGGALGKYEEIQYILRVREMLELFDLYD